MLREALGRGKLDGPLAALFGQRLQELGGAAEQGDLRVTISWNTDATDVDLWVIEPDGFKVYYAQPRSISGGQLSQDQTQGYGPERYQIARASHGTYTIIVHYFHPNTNLLGGETHVNVTVARNAGSAQESVQKHTVILKSHNEQVEVCRVKF